MRQQGAEIRFRESSSAVRAGASAVWLVLVGVMVLLVAGGWFLLRPKGVLLEVRNCSASALRAVRVGCGGTVVDIPLIAKGAARTVWLRPSGEVQTVEVSFTAQGGAVHQRIVHIYLERGYHGDLLALISGTDHRMFCAAKISLGGAGRDWIYSCPQVSVPPEQP